MTLRVRVSARATREVHRAAQWWAANRVAAPGAIASDFGDAVALLAEQPGIGAKYEGTRLPGIRRLYLCRVRYFVYYTTDGTHLDILAFWHATRRHQPRL